LTPALPERTLSTERFAERGAVVRIVLPAVGNPPLADAISEWNGDAASLAELVGRCAGETALLLAADTPTAAEALADVLIPLRAAMLRNPNAVALAPLGAFLGCLQALLRGEHAQLDRLHHHLDDPLRAAFAQVRQIADLQRTAIQSQALAARALHEDDPDARRALAIQLGQAASHYSQGAERGSPEDDLAAFLRAAAAIVRGTPVPAAPAPYAERIAALIALAQEPET
jgi:hypothetical protein